MYVTLEPCSHHGMTPPCADAIVGAGLARVVCAIEDPDPRVAGRGLARLRQAGIAVERGLLVEAAHWIAAGHILRVTERRPLVTAKLALDADDAVPRGGDGQAGVGDRRSGARRAGICCVRAPTPFWSAGAPCSTTTRCSPAACRDWSDARPRASCWRASLPGSKAHAWHRRARQHPLWVFCGEDADAGAIGAAGAEILPMRLVAGEFWLPAVMEALVARGITRLLSRVAQQLGRRSRAPASSTRRCCFARAGLTGPS